MATTVNGVLRCMGRGPDAVQAAATQPADAREVHLSFNGLTSLAGLEKFAATMETLILDNNSLVALDTLPPKLPQLKTLWLNNNSISDLEAALNVLSARCPALTYLSLLKNPCCPNELVGKNEHEYSRYRIYVKHRVPTLTTIDADVVTEEEADTARTRGQFFQTKTVAAEPPATIGPSGNAAEAPKEDFFKPADRNPNQPADAVYSNQRHFYSGNTSEGNRFIGNDLL